MASQSRKRCPDVERLRQLAKDNRVYGLRKAFNVEHYTIVRWLDVHEIAAVGFEPIRGVQARLMAGLPVPETAKWCRVCKKEIRRGKCCQSKECRYWYARKQMESVMLDLRSELRHRGVRL